jgi:hypothetical protein
MGNKQTESDQFSPEETEQRLRKLMRGAFAGPPTQMKDIPKKRRANHKPPKARIQRHQGR